jgi:phosphoglycerate dehydrogenase-like enzyme
MSLSAHLLRTFEDDAALDHLRAQLEPGIVITASPELPDPARYHVLVTGRPQREHLLASPNLRALVIPWAGLPETTRDLMLAFPEIAVYNLHYNAASVAEMVMTLMLAAAKFIVPMDRAIRAHDWRPRYKPNPALLMRGKTALILGYGAIGQRVARICRGLEMRVLAIKRRPETVQEPPDAICPPEMLHDLLPKANALLICLPHTPETTGLIGKQELALLPGDAVLVNVGRGPIVDELALYEALRDGRLYAAGLDVWYDYPSRSDESSQAHTPPSAYPFHELDNVVMSPHRAGGGRGSMLRRMDHLAVLLNALAQGEEPANRIDVHVGY